MKLRSITPVLALAAVLAGCGETPEHHAISRVMRERYALAEKWARGNGKGRHHLALGPALRDFKKMNVSGCPTDFRNAWFAYVVTLEKRHEAQEKVVGEIIMDLAPPHLALHALLKAEAKTIIHSRPSGDPLAAWETVCESSRHYQVDPDNP